MAWCSIRGEITNTNDSMIAIHAQSNIGLLIVENLHILRMQASLLSPLGILYARVLQVQSDVYEDVSNATVTDRLSPSATYTIIQTWNANYRIGSLSSQFCPTRQQIRQTFTCTATQLFRERTPLALRNVTIQQTGVPDSVRNQTFNEQV
jgi:hypothetical protein